MKVVVSAGPTREYLDPVRFLSNPSTGKMGFAVAAEAARRGHDVVLVAGPVALKTPPRVTRIDVVSARDMLAAVRGALEPSDPAAKDGTVFISTAAIADWRPRIRSASKLKKHQMSGVLTLVRNPDILKTVRADLRARRREDVTLVGFAAETDDVLGEAARKCREKGLAFIVANDVTEKGAGFGTSTNRVSFVFPDGTVQKHPLMSKRAVARRILLQVER